jgi:hypothetical protein
MAGYRPRRVIYEFRTAPDRRHVRVTAMDEDTLVEAVVICSIDTRQARMEQLAYDKLTHIQNRDDGPDDSGPNDGSVLV